MFVIFLCVILVLNVSVSRSTENKDVPFKDKLKRSLAHVEDMLFTIEHKIKQEKKKLSQIFYDLNRKENLNAARTATTVKPASEDLMLKNPYNYDAMETTPVPMNFTFATIFPSPPADTHWPPTKTIDTSVITDFSVYTETTKAPTTTLSPFMKDMKKIMREDNHNYFTAFLSRLTELIAIKNTYDTMPVIKLLLVKLSEALDVTLFDEDVGKRLTETLKLYIPQVNTMSPEKLKEQAMYAHFTVKNKATMMSPDYMKMTDFYGSYFNKQDGHDLFKALEKFYEYNNGKHTAAEVADMIIQAALKPYIRVKATGIDTTASPVNQTVEPVVQETQYTIPDTKYLEHETQYPVHVTENPITVTQNQVPSWRRNINLEESVKRVLLNNSKLLEKIKEHYKIENIKRHHHLSHKWKLNQNHRKSRDGQKKAYISSEEVYNHPKSIPDTVKYHMLHKNREDLSYRDEEESLRNNLYDALRHGNKTFVSFRKSSGDIISKQALTDLSSEPDDEWVLKNNIYKVFEQNQLS